MKKSYYHFISFVRFAFIAVTTFSPLISFAETTKYIPLTNFPGFDKVQEGNFAQFVNTSIQWFMAIAAALAVIMIIRGGLERMTKDSIQSQTDGKKRIEAAIWGLLIALSSYLLLYTINPNLVKLEIVVEQVDVKADGKFQPIDDAGQYIRGSSNQGRYTSPTSEATGDAVAPGTFPQQAWNECATNAVNNSQLSSLTPQDAARYFPNGNPTTQDWVNLLAGMSKKESNYNPNLEYRESFTDKNGNRVICTGLLQLSQESARGYGFSNMTTEQLKDPCTNIQVGVKILEKWVREDGCISCKSADGKWRGGARYWAVLRK